MGAAEKKEGRILVVDDDEDMREILRRHLTTEGYTYVSAENGARCLEILKSEPIDVVVLDVMMPGLDGLQVCEQMRKDDRLRSIPVILLTCKDDLATRQKGMELGVSEYLTKPLNKRELLARVRSQLHARELDRQLERTAASINTPSKG